MKKWFLIPIAAVLVIGLIIGGCAAPAPAPSPTPTPTPAPEKPIELKFTTWPPPVGTVYEKMLAPWGKTIEERTNGRVKITFYAGESLAKAPDTYDAVVNGTADMGWPDPGFTPGVFPLSEVANLPMVFPSSEVGGAIYWDLVKKYMMDTEFKNVKVLWVNVLGTFQGWSREKEIRTLEDLKGMKIAAQSPTLVPVIEALGGVPTFIPEPEIYTALERGIVDGRFVEFEAAWVFKTFEVTKYRTENINLAVNKSLGIMNLDVWNKLPPDIQKIFDETTGFEASQHYGKLMDEADQQFRAMILDYDKKVGNPAIYSLPENERARWEDATSGVINGWVNGLEAKGLPAKAMMDDYRSLLQKYSK